MRVMCTRTVGALGGFARMCALDMHAQFVRFGVHGRALHARYARTHLVDLLCAHLVHLIRTHALCAPCMLELNAYARYARVHFCVLGLHVLAT